MKVMVDPGHGGPVTSGYNYGAAANSVVEKHAVLTIALHMKELWPDEVRLTRSTDRLLTPSERADIANKADADLFVSLHMNAYNPRPAARGWEIFHASGSESGEKWAKKVAPRVYHTFPAGWPNRGIKSANYTVLVETKMPAILLEYGFLTNPTDAAWLSSTTNLHKLALSTGLGTGLPDPFNKITHPALKRLAESGPDKLFEGIEADLAELKHLFKRI